MIKGSPEVVSIGGAANLMIKGLALSALYPRDPQNS